MFLRFVWSWKGLKFRKIFIWQSQDARKGEKATRQLSYLYHLILYVRPYQDTFVESLVTILWMN